LSIFDVGPWPNLLLQEITAHAYGKQDDDNNHGKVCVHDLNPLVGWPLSALRDKARISISFRVRPTTKDSSLRRNPRLASPRPLPRTAVLGSGPRAWRITARAAPSSPLIGTRRRESLSRVRPVLVTQFLHKQARADELSWAALAITAAAPTRHLLADDISDAKAERTTD
jgi:hypothetical protein